MKHRGLVILAAAGLPAGLQKIIDDTTGLKMSADCGRAYDATEESSKQKSMEAGVGIVEWKEGELDKLMELTHADSRRMGSGKGKRGLSGTKNT